VKRVLAACLGTWPPGPVRTPECTGWRHPANASLVAQRRSRIPMCRACALYGIALVAATTMPTGATCQVAGIVSDRQGHPIPSALVQLLAHDSTLLKSTLTDSIGGFSFSVSGCGPRDGYLYAGRLGYHMLTAAVQDLPADCTAWTIVLEPNPVALPELPVEVSRSRSLDRVGFYSRQRIGLGTFITRDILEDRYRTASRAGDVLQQIPGVFRVDQGNNETVVHLRPDPSFTNRACAAAIYVDGLFNQKSLPRLPAQDIEAIEVYRGPAEVPAQYGGVNAACGVVLIWTRTGGR
jgi:TonB-dependent Receptor Plug Domain